MVGIICPPDLSKSGGIAPLLPGSNGPAIFESNLLGSIVMSGTFIKEKRNRYWLPLSPAYYKVLQHNYRNTVGPMTFLKSHFDFILKCHALNESERTHILGAYARQRGNQMVTT